MPQRHLSQIASRHDALHPGRGAGTGGIGAVTAVPLVALEVGTVPVVALIGGTGAAAR